MAGCFFLFVPGAWPRRPTCSLAFPALAFALLAGNAASDNDAGIAEAPGCRETRSNYGFLTRFDVADEEARATVRRLYVDFGIVDFQFYDTFYTYSQPLPAFYNGSTCAWISKPSSCFTDRPRRVRAAAIAAYVDEIRRLPVRGGGRAWLYVQAVAADEPTAELQSGRFLAYRDVNGEQIAWTAQEKCFYTYQLTPEWADRMVELWGPFASLFGFYGIHWDQLGKMSDDHSQNGQMVSGLQGFLQRAHKLLLNGWSLRQTMNFVDGFGWHPKFYMPHAVDHLVEFPYWECWSDATEWLFWGLFNYSDECTQGRIGPVFARYPDPGCCGNPTGMSANDNMWARWSHAASVGVRYLVLGDDRSRLKREYFPDSVRLSDFEHAAMAFATHSDPCHCAGAASDSALV